VTVHPIEAQSYRILRQRIDLRVLEALPRAVIERIIHASADVEYASTVVTDEASVRAGVNAIRTGAAIIADVEMVRSGITGLESCCHLSDAVASAGLTRSAAAMRIAAARHPDGAIVVVGCAPTALVEAVELTRGGAFRPALVIGLPVGFVGASESKELLRESGIPAISNVGEKGGSAVAAAALNAIARLARDERGGDTPG